MCFSDVFHPDIPLTCFVVLDRGTAQNESQLVKEVEHDQFYLTEKRRKCFCIPLFLYLAVISQLLAFQSNVSIVLELKRRPCGSWEIIPEAWN